MAKVAVIGAGVMGLSTAYALKLADEQLDVTIFAEKFSPNTTSDGAAGIFKFSQGEGGMRDTPPELLRRWANDSFQWYKELHKKDCSAKIGITQTTGFVLSSTEKNEEVKVWASTVDYVVPLSKAELMQFGPDVKSGLVATTYTCEGLRYLPWLLKKFKGKAGKVVQRKINSFGELAPYDVIINCSGLGSRDLCKDKELEPRRGQVLRLKAPWIRHFYHIYHSKPYSVYIYPNIDNIVVGGTSQNSWSLETSEEDRKKILEHASELEPSLKHAEIVRDWVGLRPSRSSVRLEREVKSIVTASGEPASLNIVHNYGHGPSGMSLHWGCALHAVQLVKTFLSGEKLWSKL